MDNDDFYIVDKVRPKVNAGMPFLKTFNIHLSFHKNLLEFYAQNDYSKDGFKKLLDDYKGIFMKNKWDVGITNLTKHLIVTNGPPIQMNPRRQPVHFQQKIKANIDEMLKNNFIEECESPWNSPIVCVKKKDSNDIRICLDFRKLNEVTERPIFPIPNVDEILDSLGGSRYFSTLDLGNAYYQIE